jgi:hypothetical protein
MPASVIPVTGLNLGPVGSISQSDFPLRTPRQVRPTDTLNLAFGETAVLNSDNTYSSVAEFILLSGTLAADTPLGLAAANTRTNGTFPLAGTQGAATPAGYYAPGNIADVMTQGTMNVQVNHGTPTAGGTVYVRVALNGAIPAGVVGGIEAAADGGNTVAVDCMKFKTGILGADGTAQVTIPQRVMP